MRERFAPIDVIGSVALVVIICCAGGLNVDDDPGGYQPSTLQPTRAQIIWRVTINVLLVGALIAVLLYANSIGVLDIRNIFD